MLLLISILIVLTAFFIYQYFTFLKIYHINQSLVKFRELRHELTIFLSANLKKDLSAQEASEYYHFLLGLNIITKYFAVLEPTFTEFNSLKSISSSILLTSDKLTSQANVTLVNHYYISKFKDCVLTAFKAIPFCKLRLLISKKLGIVKYSNQMNILERLYNFEKSMLKKEGMPCNP